MATGLIALALVIVKRKVIWSLFAVFAAILGLAALLGGVILALEHDSLGHDLSTISNCKDLSWSEDIEDAVKKSEEYFCQASCP